MSDPVIKTAQDFKDARLELGMTQKETADLLCTTPQTVRKWEAPPSARTSITPPELPCRILEELSNGWRPSWMKGPKK